MTTYKGITAGPMTVLAALVFAPALISCTSTPPASPGVSASPTSAAGSQSPTPLPSPTASPTPSPSEEPSPSQAAGPALTERFTSAMHGISVSYPAGWTTQLATEPWATSSPFYFRDPVGDFLYDPVLTDHLFLGLASQPLAGKSPDAWASDLLILEGCPSSDTVVVDGADGVLASDCGMALVSKDDRGYLIWLYASADDELDFDTGAWFQEILATVSLDAPAAVAPPATRRPGETRVGNFALPFSYIFPRGLKLGTTHATYYEIRDPARADAGHPAGVIIQAIGGGRIDPCDPVSGKLDLELSPNAPIEYLETVPDLTVTDIVETSVGELPAVQARVTSGTDSPECSEIWPWVEDTEAFTAIPRNTTVRLISTHFDREPIVLTVFGEDDNTGWTEVADEFIASLRFEPSQHPMVTGQVQVREPFAVPFEYAVPAGHELRVAGADGNIYALTNGGFEPYPAWGAHLAPGERGVVVAFSAAPTTDGNSYGDRVELRPDTFMSDLSANQQLRISPAAEVELGGLPAVQADIDQVNESSAYPYIELESSLYLNFFFPSRLIVAPTDGGVIMVHIWAGTEEDFVAWLPDATALVDSISFGD